MKHLLLLTLSLFCLSTTLYGQTASTTTQQKGTAATTTTQQNTPQTVEKSSDKSDPNDAIIALTAKVDSILTAQNTTISDLSVKINRLNNKLSNNQPSYARLFEKMAPILILFVIGLFLVAIIYILTSNNFRKINKRYDTILKCTELTGSVPNLTNSEGFNSDDSKRTTQITHLVLSILSGMISLIFFICSVNTNSYKEIALCIFAALIFGAIAVMLYLQFNSKSGDHSPKE